MSLRLSIIVPMLDEGEGLARCLDELGPLRRRGAELVVVDGGSRDDTVRLATPRADTVIVAPRGRASQMNAGAEAATGGLLLFLHADTRLPEDADRLVREALADGAGLWGRFDVTIEGSSPLLAVIARAMNLRSRLTGIATGDQALFMTRSAFATLGGFPDQPLMEDIAMSRRLRSLARPVCLRSKVTTSGRRWQRHGVLRTVMLMWRLRLSYSLGADPRRLALAYGYRPRDG